MAPQVGEITVATIYDRLEHLYGVLMAAHAQLDGLEHTVHPPAADQAGVPIPDLRQLVEMCIDRAERLENRVGNIKSQLGWL